MRARTATRPALIASGGLRLVAGWASCGDVVPVGIKCREIY